MPCFAELDENNIVVSVIVVHENDIKDENGVEQESKGIEFLGRHIRGNKRWKRVFEDGRERKRFASAGWKYDPVNDVFINPQPFPSWTLNNKTYEWEAPTKPPDRTPHRWDETTLTWVKVEKS